MDITLNILQIWLGAAFTVFVYSFAFKDNPLYRLSEHILIGSGAGYATILAIDNVRRIAWTPLTTKADWLWIVPIILGTTLFFRFSRKYFWVNRYGTAVLIAIGTALTLRTIVEAQVLSQIRATFLNPFTSVPSLVEGSVKTPINNILVIVIVVSSIFFFIFSGGSKIQKSTLANYLSKLGLYSMMLAFGATFGNTIMSRIAEMHSRILFVLSPEAIPVLPLVLLLVVLAMVPAERVKKMLSHKQ